MARPKPDQFLLALLIFFISTSLCFCHGMSWQGFLEDDGMSWLNEEDNEVDIVQTRHDPSRSCNFESGKWVYDQSYPLYDSNCPYLSTAVTCQKNGRPDSDYEKWRWQPHGCSIPRYIPALEALWYPILFICPLDMHKNAWVIVCVLNFLDAGSMHLSFLAKWEGKE